jgi:hypothetical protein
MDISLIEVEHVYASRAGEPSGTLRRGAPCRKKEQQCVNRGTYLAAALEALTKPPKPLKNRLKLGFC